MPRDPDPPTPGQSAYMKAAEIADLLLKDGVPVLGFQDFDYGHGIAIAFALDNERARYAVRLKTSEATVERFRELYEAVK